MNKEIIRSRQNPYVRELARLRDRRGREADGRFLIEGFRELGRALEHGVTVEEVIHCPSLFKHPEQMQFLERWIANGLPCSEWGVSAFEKISLRQGPDGLIGLARQLPQDLNSFRPPADALIAVVVEVEKPGNLGAIVRTAVAAGAHAIFCANPVCDIHNPNVIRSSQGLCFALPVFSAGESEILEWLRHSGLRTVATSPAAGETLWQADLTGSVALVFGSEDQGLGERWLAPPARAVRIPMAPGADSLNVAATAAIALFEATRQRGASG